MAGRKRSTVNVAEKTSVKETVENNVIIEDTVESEAPAPKRQKRDFDQNSSVLCKSIVNGALYMSGLKSAMPYVWNGYGDVTEVEYRDLVALIRVKSEYVMRPCFVIEDLDFLDEYPFLKKMYDEIFTHKDIGEILEMDNLNEMIKAIEKLPKSVVDTLKSIAASWVANGKIDSVSKIKALDKAFGTDLNILADILSDE